MKNEVLTFQQLLELYPEEAEYIRQELLKEYPKLSQRALERMIDDYLFDLHRKKMESEKK